MAEKQNNDFTFLFTAVGILAAIAASDIAKQHMAGNAAVGVGVCTIAMLATAKIRWDLRGKWWFWGALCLGAVLQFPLILFMPWAAPHLTGIGATALAVPGLLMALGCVFLAEKCFRSRASPK